MLRHVIAGTGQPYPDIKKLQTGDTANFHSLYQLFYGELVMKAASLLNEKEEAAGLVNHCFIKCWLKSEALTSIDYISAFLTTTVRNSCMAGNNSQGFRSPHHSSILDTVLSDSIRDGLSRRDLFAGVNALPAAQLGKAREAFCRLYLRHKPIAEIAEEMALQSQDAENCINTSFQILHLMLSTKNM